MGFYLQDWIYVGLDMPDWMFWLDFLVGSMWRIMLWVLIDYKYAMKCGNGVGMLMDMVKEVGNEFLL